MRSIWAVTRETLLECLRTRIAMIFLALLAVCVLGMALTFEGDGTLKGRIQTFLSYSISTTEILLALVTVFLTTSILTGDMRKKTIFTVASKPLHRWQYLIGRWLGVVLLDGLLLAASIASIYGLAQWLRRQPTQIETKHAATAGLPRELDMDRLGVETEVFTARQRRSPDPIDVEPIVEARLQQRLKERGEEAILSDFLTQKLQQEMSARRQFGQVDPAQVRQMLQDQGVREQTLAAIKEKMRQEEIGQLCLIQPGRGLRLTFSGLASAAGQRQPLQMQYQLYPVQPRGNGTLQTLWLLVNPKTGDEAYSSRTDPTTAASSLTIPPELVSDDGRMVLYYVNNTNLQDDPVAVKIKPDEIYVKFRTGGFEDNLLRSTELILIRLGFLAAVGVLFGIFLSFPVACLACLLVFTLGTASAFVMDATKPFGTITLFDRFSQAVTWAAFQVIPTFGNISPVDPIVDGTLIPTGALGWELAGTGGRTLLALILGWLIFRRKELAKVQV